MGNQSKFGEGDKITAKYVMDDIETIKNASDCPSGMFYSEVDGNIVTADFEIRKTLPVHPSGGCCHAVRPKQGRFQKH